MVGSRAKVLGRLGRAESSPTTSVCSILPIARRLRAGASRGASRPSRASQKCAVRRTRPPPAARTAGGAVVLRARTWGLTAASRQPRGTPVSRALCPSPVRFGSVLLHILEAAPHTPIASGAAFALPMPHRVVFRRCPSPRSDAAVRRRGPTPRATTPPERLIFRIIPHNRGVALRRSRPARTGSRCWISPNVGVTAFCELRRKP
jgi:hypothetical protein